MQDSSKPERDSLNYYILQSKYSDPGKFTELFDELPSDITQLCKIVHGLIAHKDSTKLIFGFDIPGERAMEANSRYVEKIIEKILSIDSSPLAVEREPIKRFLGSCRDFNILLCSILRNKGIPARVRCGFAHYFNQTRYSDHWVCEYWSDNTRNWLLADAEMGEAEKVLYKLTFDPTNIPREQFLSGGEAWEECQQGKIDPNLFGVHPIGIKGLWFVRADVLRDLASLNKVELLPWDYTPFFDKHFSSIDGLLKEEIHLIDEISDVTSYVSFDFEKIKSMYQENKELQVTGEIRSYLTSQPLHEVLT